MTLLRNLKKGRKKLEGLIETGKEKKKQFDIFVEEREKKQFQKEKELLKRRKRQLKTKKIKERRVKIEEELMGKKDFDFGF